MKRPRYYYTSDGISADELNQLWQGMAQADSRITPPKTYVSGDRVDFRTFIQHAALLSMMNGHESRIEAHHINGLWTIIEGKTEP